VEASYETVGPWARIALHPDWHVRDTPEASADLPEPSPKICGTRSQLSAGRRAQLRVGQHHGPRALLASGIFMARVLGHRTQDFTFSDVVFAPLVWSLVPDDKEAQPVDQLADASEWPNYSSERTRVDLRHIVRRFPTFLHHAFSGTRDQWIELMGEAGTDTEAVILHGRRRGPL
jgi:hypothetical protein